MDYKRETRSGNDLSVEQIFDKASAVVYRVNAGEGMGSAVAIGDRSCSPTVTL
jgi:hypothetical protein